MPLDAATLSKTKEQAPPSPVPQDLASALSLIETLRNELDESHRELGKSQRENEQLQRKVDELCRKLFGKKTEKVDPNQLHLALEIAAQTKSDEPIETDAGEGLTERKKRRGGTGRRPLPKDLRVVSKLNDISDDQRICACCQVAKVEIGRDSTKKIDYEPSSLYVVETITPRYACPRCHEGVVAAPAPLQAVQRGLAAEGLLAHIVTSKYADHLPLYRLEGILERHGVAIDRSTLCGWVGQVADALEPIYGQIRSEILKTDYLQTDDTSVVILGVKGSYKGRLWAYRDPIGRQTVYDATRTHERDGPENFLGGFGGYLQADAYKGYDGLYRSGRITEVACWAHARRRFFDARETDRARADAMLALVQQLYQVEKDAATATPERRKALRQERSVPILTTIDALRRQQTKEVLPKSPMGDALRYLNNQWLALNRYVEDGRLIIDNNNAERDLRQLAVGRKNWMFAGRFVGAQRASILYTLVACCRLQGVDPFVYFRDLLVRVATHPQSRIADLTPRRWKMVFADASGSMPTHA